MWTGQCRSSIDALVELKGLIGTGVGTIGPLVGLIGARIVTIGARVELELVGLIGQELKLLVH